MKSKSETIVNVSVMIGIPIRNVDIAASGNGGKDIAADLVKTLPMALGGVRVKCKVARHAGK